MILQMDQIFKKKQDICIALDKKINNISTYAPINKEKNLYFWSITFDLQDNKWTNKIVDDYLIEYRPEDKKVKSTVANPEITRLLFVKQNGEYQFKGVYHEVFIDGDSVVFYKKIADKFDTVKQKAI